MFAYAFVLVAAVALAVGWLDRRSVVLVGAVITATVALAALGLDEWSGREVSANPDRDAADPMAENDGS
jgi:hypothetical protein